MIDRLIDKSIN